MCVNGSLIRSSTWRSSSVSAPCISSSICLPSSPERSRTMRGSFCQALPIGCIRVFMTPSCSSAVTLESRCSGTLNSVSSLRREISRSWLRVSTSSETMVIRCSSVSTLTRIDWLAILSASWTSASTGDGGLLGRLCLGFLGGSWRRGARLPARARLLGDGGRGAGWAARLRSRSRGRRARGRRARLRRDAADVPAPAPPACPWQLPGHRGLHRRCGHDRARARFSAASPACCRLRPSRAASRSGLRRCPRARSRWLRGRPESP